MFQGFDIASQITDNLGEIHSKSSLDFLAADLTGIFKLVSDLADFCKPQAGKHHGKALT